MLLAIDVGNTNIVFGVFKGKRLVKTWRRKTQVVSGKWLVVRGKITDVIVSSVVPKIDSKLRRVVKRKFGVKPIFVTHKNIKLGIKLKKKAQVGADRLVNAYAAWKLYGGPAIIVDFGTATTFCGINGRGEYLGGAIAPGVRLSAHALHTGTAKLPEIDVKYTSRVIGKTTVEAMRAGLYYGYVALVEGMVKKVKEVMGVKGVKVVATGGFSEELKKHTRVFDVVNKNLTLYGLGFVWEDLNV
jgi:type III pantothenate kinase